MPRSPDLTGMRYKDAGDLLTIAIVVDTTMNLRGRRFFVCRRQHSWSGPAVPYDDHGPPLSD